MRAFLSIVVALFSGFVAMNVAIGVIFPYLLNARFPLSDIESIFRASSTFDHYSFVLFVLSSLGAASVFAGFFENQSKLQLLIGALAAVIAGIVTGTLTTVVYFYSTYSFSN